MRECQQCGERNQPTSKFCVVCGSPLSGPSAAGYAAVAPGGTGRPNAGPSINPNPLEIGHDVPLDGPRVLVGFLVSFEGVETGQYWPIHQGTSSVGRQGAASGLDIEIAHPTTSSMHASLLAAAQPGRIIVEDAGSTNGTFVNDNPLAAGQRWELRDGDRLRFGLFDTIVKIIER